MKTWTLFFLSLSVLLSESCAAPEDSATILSIGSVQGVVSDQDDGGEHQSTFDGKQVQLQGVVYQFSMWANRGGSPRNGMFIQNLPAESDNDENSSDGMFVYLGVEPVIGQYRPKVGDHIVVEGYIEERHGQTELKARRLIKQLAKGLVIDDVLPKVSIATPEDPKELARYFERLEGMRVHVPKGSTIQGGRKRDNRTGDDQVYVVAAGYSVLKRKSVYERRVFRDPHPLDDQSGKSFDNDNGYRFIVGSMGLKAAQRDTKAVLSPVRTFDQLATDLPGALHYTYAAWIISAAKDWSITPGPDPLKNHPPVQGDRATSFSIASFNLENLYDHRNDPHDPCDFKGDPGRKGVYKPFNYLPESAAAYRQRLTGFAKQIMTHLGSPDVILAQELEDQDIAKVVKGKLVFGKTNNADGAPDVLQELAEEMVALGGPEYRTAYDREASDARGIVCAFLYRADRVELLRAKKNDLLFGKDKNIPHDKEWLNNVRDVQNPKAFNAVFGADPEHPRTIINVFSRAVVGAHLRVWSEKVGEGASSELYIFNNHFSSRPDKKVERRRAQAALNAALAKTVMAENPEALVLIGGDLNVFPRPDDPFPKKPSDQLGPLYEAGLTNLYDRMLREQPEAAYSYVYHGQAGTLDHFFASPALFSLLEDVAFVHLNTDETKGFGRDATRGLSDHDPLVARFSFSRKKE